MPTYCIEINCNTRACFNKPTDKIGIYCKKHKKEGMVNIKNKRCIECNTRPL
jgi:hypothetical protein